MKHGRCGSVVEHQHVNQAEAQRTSDELGGGMAEGNRWPGLPESDLGLEDWQRKGLSGIELGNLARHV